MSVKGHVQGDFVWRSRALSFQKPRDFPRFSNESNEFAQVPWKMRDFLPTAELRARKELSVGIASQSFEKHEVFAIFFSQIKSSLDPIYFISFILVSSRLATDFSTGHHQLLLTFQKMAHQNSQKQWKQWRAQKSLRVSPVISRLSGAGTYSMVVPGLGSLAASPQKPPSSAKQQVLRKKTQRKLDIVEFENACILWMCRDGSKRSMASIAAIPCAAFGASMKNSWKIVLKKCGQKNVMSTVSTKCASTNKWRRKAEHQSRDELARMCKVKCCSYASETAKRWLRLSLMKKNEKLIMDLMDHSNITTVRYLKISEI